MSDYTPKGRPLTGRKVLAIAVGAFAVILTANITMLVAATGTFPGLIVKNSYKAGIGFDDRTAAQEALGWSTRVGHDGTRLVALIEDAEGRAVEGLTLSALVGRPASDTEDRRLSLRAGGGEGYAAPVELDAGLWRVVIEADLPDGRSFRKVARLDLAGGETGG